ncbi:MAG: adenosylcobinamide-GDP ribazoletransferase [Pseudomonadota bacterium]
MFLLHPFLIALQFLTILPVRLKEPPDSKAMGRSLPYYPLIGLLLGALLAFLGWGLGDAPTLIATALILAVWVLLTGGMHLDGLADSADAWIGGMGNRQKTLAIMKDPCCGPAAVATLLLLLLIKFAALEHLVATKNWEILMLPPVLGRTTLVLLFLTTPYVRPNGLGSQIANHFSRRASAAVTLFVLVAVFLFIGIAAFWLLLPVAGAFLVLRTLMQRRIGGATGDTAGALVEITETAVLLTAALMG